MRRCLSSATGWPWQSARAAASAAGAGAAAALRTPRAGHWECHEGVLQGPAEQAQPPHQEAEFSSCHVSPAALKDKPQRLCQLAKDDYLIYSSSEQD